VVAPRLAAERLSKRFPAPGGGVEALAGADLEVGAGEFVSVVGPSGCGKSTLLAILAGLEEPSAGRVLLDGEQPERLLGQVAYMPQRDLLLPWRTVADNAALALRIRGLPRRQARAAALAQLPRFGLAGFGDRRPASLSGGMRQRAALLRTFLAGREVMLLDEPFGALDALTRQALQVWLLEVCQEQGRTVLLVTHDLDEAVLLSDRVYVMSGRPGRMVRCLPVGLPRPRRVDMALTPPFLAAKRELLEPLRQEAHEEVVDASRS
jgi:ABC-type nitrate/sulfonate/bicarbonate transport system ATPase subunit